MHTNLKRSAGIIACLVAVLGSTDSLASQWRDGNTVYDKVCGHCHEMGVGPVIKGRQLPVEYVRRVVRFGNRAMPSFRPSEIDDATLGNVAAMINTSAVPAKK